jgi:hAT family C-terminal dimerisation region
MIHTQQNLQFPEAFRLLKLTLVLPIATSSVERAFSAMTFIKNKLRNKMCDQWMNDCLLTYIEKETFINISNESIMYYYQDMGSRRFKLAKRK